MQRRLQVNGLTFNVRDEGAGEPVLLVHGFPDDHTVWRKQMPALVAAGYRVIAPDNRGCGESEMARRTGDYALSHLVADLIGILDALEIGKVRLVGHDWGAVIGWVLSVQHPERVERYAALSVGHMAAYAAGPLEQKLKGWYVALFQMRGLAEQLIKARDWTFLRWWARDHSEMAIWLPRLSRPGRLTAWLSYYRANFSQLLRPYKTKATVPVLGVFSDDDPYLAKAQMIGSAAFVEAPFRYELIEGVGHWMQIDAAEQVNALLVDFFAKNFKE